MYKIHMIDVAIVSDRVIHKCQCDQGRKQYKNHPSLAGDDSPKESPVQIIGSFTEQQQKRALRI